MVDKAARIALMHLKYHLLSHEETRNNESWGEGREGLTDGLTDN